MASVMKPSRYSSYDSRSSTSSYFSDPSSSTELKHKSPIPGKGSSSSRVLVKAKPSDLARTKSKPSDPNFTALVKKFMEKRSNTNKKAENRVGLVIPNDVIAEDLKKTARKGSNFAGLHKKLFGKGTTTPPSSAGKEKREVKALTEVKANTRTLAMVLRSERELLSLTKDQESEISELKFMLEDKNKEVEKLKDLCLKQREEIKELKNAILFPDAINLQLQNVLEKQGSELKQAKELIPTLQMQVTSLTGQLQCLAEDLAEVKADKYTARTGFQHHSGSPRIPMYSREEASNSLEFSSGDSTCPGSPDDMLVKDLNPCLTPYSVKRRSKELGEVAYDSPHDDSLSDYKRELGFNKCVRRLSKSSECCHNSKAEITTSRAARRSDEAKCLYGSYIIFGQNDVMRQSRIMASDIRFNG